MVGKVSERVLAREGKLAPNCCCGRFWVMCVCDVNINHINLGLERTDNGMKQSSWPDVVPINQKNYYT